MSGGRRTHWPHAIALAAIVLSCPAGSPPARAGAGGSRREPDLSAIRTEVSLRPDTPGTGRRSPGEVAIASPAVAEESRPGDDIETEIVLDTASAAVAPTGVEAGARAGKAREARAIRRPFLLTARLRF